MESSLIRTEEELIKLAQTSPDDTIANKAMEELRKNYDDSYCWCLMCDLAVVKKSQCCENREK